MLPDPSPQNQTLINLDPRSYELTLLLGFTTVTALGLVIEALAAGLNDDWLLGLFPVISLNYEQNLPAWYLMGLYLMGSLLAGLILAVDPRRHQARLLWASLAAGLAWLSLDELSAFSTQLTFTARAWLRPDLIERAVQDHGTALIFAGTMLVAALILSIRLGFRIAVQGFALPADCQLRLAAGLMAISIAPFVVDWSLPFRLWYDLGGQEPSSYLVHKGLEWLRNALETAGASLVCAALVSYLSGQERPLMLAWNASRSGQDKVAAPVDKAIGLPGGATR